MIVATGENEPARVRNALVQLGARRHHRRSCSRAARTWPARSSTPARSTRSACSSRPCVLGGSTARDPLEGEGVERIAEAARALTLDCERDRRRRPDHRPHAGVVSVFTGLVADLGTVTAVDATRRRRAARRAHRARRRARRGRLGRRQRRLPDRDARSPTARFAADVMHETLRRSSLGRGRRGRAGQPRAAAARRPTGSAATSCRATSTASATVARRRARTASPASSTIDAPPELLRYVVEKGSIAVDGVSLTVVDAVTTTSFSVSLIPETLERTTSARPRPGSREPGGGRARQVRREAGRCRDEPAVRDRSRRRSRTSAPAGWSSSATTRTARTRATSRWPPSSPRPRRSTSWPRRGAG